MKVENKYIIDNNQLMSEWNYKRNQEIGFELTMMTFGSIQKVWWKCKTCGNEWRTSVSNRTVGEGCPVCGKKK